MRTLLRIVTTLVALVLVVVIAAVLILTLYFDPNDYKDQLAEAVQTQTGRRVAIEGDIGLSVFPWLGIDVGRLELGNAPGFQEPVFASTERVQIRVKLLPLLKKQIQMDTVTLHGLRLKLARDEQGRGNWEDLAQAGAAESKPPEDPQATPQTSSELPLASLAIGGLDVRQAHVEWVDAQAEQKYTLDDVTLTTNAIVSGRPVKLDLKFRVRGDTPEIDGDVSLQSEIEFDLPRQHIRIRSLVLNTALRGAGVPADVLDLRLETRADVDLVAETLNMPEFRAETLGVAVRGAASAEKLLSTPAYNASLKVAEFSPRKLMERLGQAPMVTADPKALSRMSLDTRMSGSTTRLTMERLTARLDDTTLEGRVEMPRFEGPAVRFHLTVDAIDADRYLPPPADDATTPAATPGAAAGAAGGEIPLEALRSLDVLGQLRVGSLKISNLRITDVLLKLTGKDGIIKLNPVQAQLYDGNYDGHMQLNAQGKQLKVSVDEKLTAVQAGPLLKDLLGKDRLTGKATASAKLSFQGADAKAARKTLNGRSSFMFLDGAVKGINIGRMIREAKARLDGKPLPPSDEPVQTDFTELSGSVYFTDGVARNDDLQAKSPLLRVRGKGTADLPKEQVDYLLTTVVVGSGEGQGGKALEDLKGLQIPIKVTGNLQEPKYRLDLKTLLAAEGKQKSQQRLEELIEKKVDEDIQEPVKNLLRDLFR